MAKNDSLFDRIQAKQGLTAKNLSQMSHISERGTPSAEVEKLQAAEKRKAEVRATNLAKALARLETIKAQLAGLPVVGPTQQVGTITKVIARLDKMVSHASCPHGLATPFRRLRNELVSMREAVLSKGNVKASWVTSNQIDPVINEVKALHERATMKVQATNDLVRVKNDFDAAFNEAERIIKKNNEAVKRLDSIRNRPFTLVRVPIVVISNPPLSAEALKRNGVNADDLTGYPLLHNQMVLGVSSKALTEKKVKVEDYVDELIEVLRKQTRRPLVLVDKRSERAKDAIWFWVADEKEVDRIMRAARGRLSITRWGFGMNT